MPTLIMLIIAAVIIVGITSKAYYAGDQHGKAVCESEHEEADARNKKIADDLEKEAANHITDMDAAFEVGVAKGKVDQAKFEAKGASDVQRYAVFSNPVCTLPAEPLADLNAARAAAFGGVATAPAHIDVVRPDDGADKRPDLHTSTDSGQVHGPVRTPATSEPAGRKDGNPVHPSDQDRKSVV